MMKRFVSVAAVLMVIFATFGAVMAKENSVERAEKKITDAEEKIADAQEKIDEKKAESADVTVAENHLKRAETVLAQARDALNAGEYKEARKLAHDASKLAMHAKRGKSFKKMKLLHLYDVFFYQMERHRIGMEAIIEYVNENEDTNAGSGQLVVIKESFVAIESELEAAANANDDKEFKKILKDSRDLTKDFRKESHRVLGAEGEIGAARTKVNEALEENKEYLQTLLDNIQQSRRESELEIIDEANDKIRGKIEDIKEKGETAEEIEEKLEEIEGAREELEDKLKDAIESCEGVSVNECDTAQAQEYRELKEKIKQDYKALRKISKKVGKARRISKAVKDSFKVLKKTEKRMSKAEKAGKDVAVPKAKFDEVKGMIDSVEAKYNEGDYEGALEDLKNAKEAFEAAQKEYVELKKEALEKTKERREDVIDTAKERRDEAIEKAKERREEAIEKAKKHREEAIDKAEERREEALEKAKERREDGKAF